MVLNSCLFFHTVPFWKIFPCSFFQSVLDNFLQTENPHLRIDPDGFSLFLLATLEGIWTPKKQTWNTEPQEVFGCPGANLSDPNPANLYGSGLWWTREWNFHGHNHDTERTHEEPGQHFQTLSQPKNGGSQLLTRDSFGCVLLAAFTLLGAKPCGRGWQNCYVACHQSQSQPQGLGELGKGSRPSRDTSEEITQTIHVWYIYLHLPYFIIKNNQM